MLRALMCLILIIVHFTNAENASMVLQERHRTVNLVTGEESQVSIDVLRKLRFNQTVKLSLTFETDDTNIIEMKKLVTVNLFHGSSFDIKIKGLTAGVVTVTARATSDDVSLQVGNSGDALRFTITVGHSRAVHYVCIVFGWLYVILWNLSFYPQVIDNFRRRCVIGMHFDYLAFNTVGHTCYMIYNLGLFTVPSIDEEYHRRHPFGANPVEFNDLFFPIHAVVLCITGIIQCCVYERGNQKVSYTCRIIIGVFLLLIGDRLYLAFTGAVIWLDWLYFLALIKLIITLLKYIPQAYLNFKRKSTHGWAVGTVLFDLFGGFFSLSQQIVLAWDHNDWGSLLGNSAKMGLGVFSILFDILFIVQHFCLYRNAPNTASQRELICDEECTSLIRSTNDSDSPDCQA